MGVIYLLKKSLVMAIFATCSISAMADDYKYITFETTDGGKTSVDISALTLGIDGNTLVAGNKTFILSNLKKMYFSVSDETMSTGINPKKLIDMQEVIAIYDMQGNQVDKNQMNKGVYIVKTKSGTYKIESR